MRKKGMLVFSLIFIAANLFFLGCDKDEDSSSSTSDVLKFFSAAQKTGPSVTPSEVSSSASTDEQWTFGNVLYEVFNLIREYDNDRDEGIIGISNMYKAVYQASSFYDSAVSFDLGTVSGTITPPIDFGNSVSYTLAGNDTTNKHGYALASVEDGTDYALLTWQVDGSESTEYGVLEGNHNETSGDVQIDLAAYVDYASQDYSLRSYIKGNEKTGLFSLKLMKYTADSGYAVSIVGYGYSKDGYYLFKVTDNNALSSGSTKYFCFASDATEADLKAMDVSGVDAGAISANCSDYQNEVDNLAMWNIDGSDLPTASTDFNSGSTTSPGVEGSIYVNY